MISKKSLFFIINLDKVSLRVISCFSIIKILKISRDLENK